MSSILTNTSAMVALQTLKGINADLSATQQEISTGKSIASAKDNSAIWAISKVMESDVAGFKAIQGSLALGESSVAVARNATETITSLLTDIKSKIVASQESNVDRDKIQTDISQLRDQITSVTNAAQFNGLNLIKGTDDVNILSSLDRAADGSVSSSNIRIARQDMTTSSGTIGTAAAANNANAVILDSATAVTSTGNTAVATLTGTWAANDTVDITVGGFQLNLTASGDIDATGGQIEGAINALGLEGISAAYDAGTDALTITSGRAFEDFNVQIGTVTTAGDGDVTITAVNGGAPSGTNSATNSTIGQRAEEVQFSATALVNEGDGYGVQVGGSTYNYVAGKGETFEDVARGVKAAIDAAGLEGVSTRVVTNDTGGFSLLVDNDGSGSASLALGRTATEGGVASGGLFGLDAIDVRTTAGADAALSNIETLIQSAIDGSASFGSAQSRVETQSDFISKLTDSLKSGIGTMVDADLEATSARLQALQVQQQLGIQSLSIANQSPQAILSLFR